MTIFLEAKGRGEHEKRKGRRVSSLARAIVRPLVVRRRATKHKKPLIPLTNSLGI